MWADSRLWNLTSFIEPNLGVKLTPRFLSFFQHPVKGNYEKMHMADTLIVFE